MRVCSNNIVLLAIAIMSLTLFGCAGSKQQAKAPDTNPWADYKGTWAPGGSQTIEEEPKAKPAKVAKADDAKPSKAESKPAKESKEAKPEAKPVKVAVAESKPAKVADPKPAKSDDDAKPAKTADKGELKPDDARSMYGLPVSAAAPADDAEEAPARPAKKKGGKKAGGKKKSAKR